MSALVLIALALAGLCALFAALYLVARRYDNYGVVDVAWAYAFGLLMQKGGASIPVAILGAVLFCACMR